MDTTPLAGSPSAPFTLTSIEASVRPLWSLVATFKVVKVATACADKPAGSAASAIPSPATAQSRSLRLPVFLTCSCSKTGSLSPNWRGNQ